MTHLEVILKDLQETEFTYIPFFKDSIDNVIGFLTVNRKADFFSGGYYRPRKSSQ